jgi:hypothetical protein
MNNKYLIEICLNLNDWFSEKDDELSTTGLVVMDSFIVKEEEKDYFLVNNLPILLNGLVVDWKDLYKSAKTVEKITKKDFIIRIQPLSETTFMFV